MAHRLSKLAGKSGRSRWSRRASLAPAAFVTFVAFLMYYGLAIDLLVVDDSRVPSFTFGSIQTISTIPACFALGTIFTGRPDGSLEAHVAFFALRPRHEG